jgi:mono/diheme cytochrome c family protein
MKRALGLLAGLIVLGAIGFAWLTRPVPLTLADLPAHQPNAENGAYQFYAAGCASCHAAPDAKGDDKLKLTGGLRLESPFGAFVAPNISPHPTDGLGAWSELDFVNAMWKGIGRKGEHLYPSFPYASYARMPLADVRDLFAYLKTLPPVAGRAAAHELGFPFNIRLSLGAWKLLYLAAPGFTPPPSASPAVARGAALTQGPGHCAECHSPRNLAGAIDGARRFAGGPDAEGRGYVPNITPDKSGIGGWSKSDIAELLKTGFTPDYDSVGGSMAPVIRNTAQLTDADRAAMAEYLKSLPAIASPPRPKKAP